MEGSITKMLIRYSVFCCHVRFQGSRTHSSECFGHIKDWVEKKVRHHLAHAQKRRGFGWERWSRPWLYNILKLFHGYRVRRDGPKVAPAG